MRIPASWPTIQQSLIATSLFIIWPDSKVYLSANSSRTN
jgi:hypothetical protein